MKWLTQTAEAVEGTELARGVELVLATRCLAHQDVRPLNDVAGGAECPICVLQAGPPVVHQVRYTARCALCGFAAQGTVQEFDAAKWDVVQALGGAATFQCAGCLLGLTRA